MKRRGNVISPIDTINTLSEMLVGTDFTVEDGETEDFSSLTYVQKFTIKLAIYAVSGSSGPEMDEKKRAAENALRRTTKLTVPNADAVLHVRATGGGTEYASQMREAQNVVLASGAWEVLVQATRPENQS